MSPSQKNNSNEINKQTVFISGASSGIGAATALLFAKQGANLILVGRRKEQLQKVAAEAESHGVQVSIFNCDINNTKEVKNIFESIQHLDIAINNAGIEGKINDTTLLEDEDYDLVMNTNVKALWHCMQEQIRWWRNRQVPGSIINVSSIAGIRGFAESSIYVASKHAVIGLTKAIALEQIRHGIRINSVSPGAIDTEMLRRIYPTNLDAVSRILPAKRVGESSEIAEAIVWLASQKSSYVVGHNLIVDGGKTIQG